MSSRINPFLEDLKGIVVKPGPTLGRLMKEKNWVPAFILLMVAMGVLTYLMFPAQIAKMAENPQFAEMLENRGELLSPETGLSRVLGSFMALFGLFISLVFGAFFLFLFFGIGGSEGEYGNYFALTVNASIIDILLASLVTGISLLSGIHLSAAATPFVLVFAPEPNSLGFLALARLNVFTIWYFVAVALGISAYSKMSVKKCLIISFLYFLFKALVGISSSYLLIKIFNTPA